VVDYDSNDWGSVPDEISWNFIVIIVSRMALQPKWRTSVYLLANPLYSVNPWY